PCRPKGHPVDRRSAYPARQAGPPGRHGPAPYARLPYWVLERRDLTSSGKVLLGALQRDGWRSGVCTNAEATLARYTGLSRRTVQRSLEELGRLGLVRIEEEPTNPTGRRIVLRFLDGPVRGADAAPAPGGRVRHPVRLARAPDCRGVLGRQDDAG